MSKILMHMHDEYGCGHYRAKNPAEHCFHYLQEQGCRIQVDTSLQSEETWYDSYVFHRMPTETLAFFADNLKAKGRKIVWEVDDDLYHIPKWMPTEEIGNNTWGFSKMLTMADQIWVSTPILKEMFGYPDKTHVLPNLIDANAFLSRSDVVPRDEDEPLRILWTGGRSHEKDLECLVKPLEELLNEYGHRIEMVFWGYIPTQMLEYYRVSGTMQALMRPKAEYESRIWFLEGLPFKFYYDRLVMMQADIALCPLLDCTFNRAKTNLKYLEMSMAGSAVIATNIEPYKCISDGVDGVLVEPEDENGWYNAIKNLIEDPDMRSELAKNAKKKVIEQYSWQSPHKYKWVDAFRSLI